MRPTQKILLLATTTAMAMTPSGAFAASGVEAVDEASAAHCSQVSLSGDHAVAGGCPLHATGAASLAQHTGVAEQVFSTCTYEFVAQVNESGSGWIHAQLLGGAGCQIEPCDEAAPEHADLAWPARIDETATGVLRLRTTICIRNVAASPEGSPGTSCTLDIAVNTLPDHAYSLSADESPCINLATSIELSGTWALEDTGVEIAHL